jgi:hypothetical protein
MKTRNGFVSNSSSSSFIILGIQLDQETVEKMGGCDFFEEKFRYVHTEGGSVIIGDNIGRWSDEDGDGDVGTLDVEKLMEQTHEVQKVVLGLFPENTPPVKLIFGTTYG